MIPDTLSAAIRELEESSTMSQTKIDQMKKAIDACVTALQSHAPHVYFEYSVPGEAFNIVWSGSLLLRHKTADAMSTSLTAKPPVDALVSIYPHLPGLMKEAARRVRIWEFNHNHALPKISQPAKMIDVERFLLKDFVEFVRAQRPLLASIIEHAKGSFEGNVLTLNFSKEDAYYRDQIRANIYFQPLAGLLNEYTGIHMPIQVLD